MKTPNDAPRSSEDIEGRSYVHFKTLEQAQDSGHRFLLPGDRFSVDIGHPALGARLEVVADPEGGLAVVAAVGLRVEATGPGWRRARFVVLGSESTWGIDSLENGYGYEVAEEQLREALIEAHSVLEQVKGFEWPKERTS